MKNNMNSLKKIIREFLVSERVRKFERRVEILDEIVFFGNKKISIPLQDSRDGIVKSVDSRASILPLDAVTYLPGTDFFRVRRLDAYIENPTVADFWEPPLKLASPGRLNRKGESLLYISTELNTAMTEVDAQWDDNFFVIIYKATKEISLTEVKLKVASASNAVERVKLEFLNSIFNRKGRGSHKLSQFIAQRYARWEADGWRYMSSKAEGGVNVCIWPPTRNGLTVNAVLQLSKGETIAIHDVKPDGTVVSERDRNAIQTRVREFETEFIGPRGGESRVVQSTLAIKVLPALS